MRFVTGAYQIHETLTKRTYRTHSDTSTMATHTKPYVCCRQKAKLRSVRSTGFSVDHDPPVIIRPSSHGSDGTICTHKIPHPSARYSTTLRYTQHLITMRPVSPAIPNFEHSLIYVGCRSRTAAVAESEGHMDDKPRRKVSACCSASGTVVEIVLTWWH